MSAAIFTEPMEETSPLYCSMNGSSGSSSSDAMAAGGPPEIHKLGPRPALMRAEAQPSTQTSIKPDRTELHPE